MSIKLPDPSKTRNSRRAGVRPRSRFRVLHRMQAVNHTFIRERPLSIRRGQVWTSVVRMTRDARAEQYRAERIRYLSNFHEVGDEETKAAAARELRRVPDAPAAAARFEAPLVRDKRTAKPNKYATAPAGTRAAHKRTCPMDRREDGCWLLARIDHDHGVIP